MTSFMETALEEYKVISAALLDKIIFHPERQTAGKSISKPLSEFLFSFLHKVTDNKTDKKIMIWSCLWLGILFLLSENTEATTVSEISKHILRKGEKNMRETHQDQA